MIGNKRLFAFLTMLLISALLFACSNDAKPSENRVPDGDQHGSSQQEPGDVEPDPADEDKQQNEPEEDPADGHAKPEDQGDANVWFAGHVEVSTESIVVEGTTNLLPDSVIRLLTSAEKGVLIGSNDQTKVNPDGTFTLEASFPKAMEGYLHFELEFDPYYQDEPIQQHYAGRMEGNFVRVYTNLEEVFDKASYKHTVYLTAEKQLIEINEPVWNIPADYKDPAVWMESEVEREDEYFIVKIKSNIIEEAFIRARIHIPNYIVAGFSGSGYTSPDGTAILYVNNPQQDSRIKDVSELNIVITMDPSDGNNGPHVKEAYGENGEKLSGDLVKLEYDERQVIEQVIHMKLD